MAIEWKGEVLGVLETRRHYGNYFKGIANFKETKSRILRENDPAIILQELELVKDKFSSKELVQELVIDRVDQEEVIIPRTNIVVKTMTRLTKVKEIG